MADTCSCSFGTIQSNDVKLVPPGVRDVGAKYHNRAEDRLSVVIDDAVSVLDLEDVEVLISWLYVWLEHSGDEREITKSSRTVWRYERLGS